MSETFVSDLADVALAWARLRAVLPPVAEVRIRLRRRTGQWLCQVERTTGVGPSESEAMTRCAEALSATRLS